VLVGGAEAGDGGAAASGDEHRQEEKGDCDEHDHGNG
jgi:hypothetical protein